MPEIAIVQASPVHNDLKASLEKALAIIEISTRKGAELIVFGECWLSGYPAWIDCGLNVAKWDHEPVKEAFLLLYQNAISIDSKPIEKLKSAAKKFNTNIVIGVNEVLGKGPGNGTVFNSLLTFSSNGKLANHHRKLMPTYNEKLLFGTGDGAGLKAVETPIGRIGGLICWEHWMPLARQTMHNEAEDFHIAVWPSVKEMHQVASRHYAFEGRCYVIAAGQLMRVSDIPEGIELPVELSSKPDHLLLNGGSCIVGPSGNYLVEPQFEEKEIIFASIPGKEQLIKEKMTLAVSGHYQRPDIFNFITKKERYY